MNFKSIASCHAFKGSQEYLMLLKVVVHLTEKSYV